MKHKFVYSEHELEMTARALMVFNAEAWRKDLRGNMEEILTRASNNFNGKVHRFETGGVGVRFGKGPNGYDASLDFYLVPYVLFCKGEYHDRLMALK